MQTPTAEEMEIRKGLDDLVQALRAKDIEALMAHYAADTVVFDIRPPLRIESADAYRENFEAWFASVDGPIDYEVHELLVTVRDAWRSAMVCATSEAKEPTGRSPTIGCG
ncbi:MAG: hypothetical protein E5Y79_27200 [Mesorhizobium sp.]|uniref:YybH family protein n=1 Tax=Mesorhizobium sp. TaxID=1871066 RepID=UPI0012103DAA|nr:nuclear transport factor 2 family protein [Mesorhizobium sp.]TIL56968.1 MAG: hypothetical protein E5Y79_27200 [Mesorhizobium sp.]